MSLTGKPTLQRLSLALARYLDSEGLEGLFAVDADISWGPDLLVQPDLFIADPEEMRRTKDWSGIQTLHLVVEVLSPASLRADRFTKRRVYQEQRIPVYWVMDIDNRQVEVWLPGGLFPVVEHEQITWHHPAAKTGCVVELATLFRPV